MLLLGAVLGSFLLVATPSGVNADGYENDDDHSNEHTNDDDGCTASVFFVAQVCQDNLPFMSSRSIKSYSPTHIRGGGLFMFIEFPSRRLRAEAALG